MNYKILRVFYWSAFSLVAIVMVLAFAAVCAFGATIEGPESVQIGQLATYTTEIEGDAILVPAKGIALAKDSNRKTFYVASQLDGEFTLIFFGVENGQPTITQRAITVGTPEPAPEPEPTPEPGPTPPPDSLESVLQQEVQALGTSARSEEFQAMQSAFQAVIDGVKDGSIQTAPDARATLRIVWQKEAAPLEGALDRWKSFLDGASKGMDLQTLEGMKTDCEKVVNLLKTYGQEESNCADGQCKTVQRGWRR